MASVVLVSALQAVSPGEDVKAVFARAQEGKPLRYVALGGSITQSGAGWIGDWLREKFPDSNVTVINAGMSATGSSLGIFRLERDVIAYQPDLVAIEFCVNDGRLTDEEATRYLETMIVRLKQLPNPPAIVILEAAAQGGVNLERHRRVAQHYGLLEVDLQRAVDEHLKETDKPWDALFRDAVHLNPEGNAFYTQTIIEALEPLRLAARQGDRGRKSPMPPPLSVKPLLLDAAMIPLNKVEALGWKGEHSTRAWWDRFSLGYIASDQAGAVLELSLRGTTFGVFYPMHPQYGRFLASVDGAAPVLVSTNHRDGFSYEIFASDRPSGEHRLTMVLPANAGKRMTFLGAVLIAGQTMPGDAQTAQGGYSADLLRQLNPEPLPADTFSWTGLVKEGMDDLSPDTIHNSTWQPVPPQEAAWIDLRKLSGVEGKATFLARTKISSDAKREVLIGLVAGVDARLWVNGNACGEYERGFGDGGTIRFFPTSLEFGENELLLAVTADKQALGFSLHLIELPQ